jgi:hypothetical protein
MKKVRVLAGIATLTPAVLVLNAAEANAATKAAGCGDLNYVHFLNINGVPGQDRSFCFAGDGPPDWTGGAGGGVVDEICGGNNSGYYSISGYTLGLYKAYFHKGTTFVHVPDYGQLTHVHISRWGGNDQCG